jgi:hypothetical protein
MGNSTTTKPRKLSPKRNVEPHLNAIRRRLPQLKNEANALQNAFKRLGPRINSGTFNERDLVAMELIPRRMQEIVNEKKALDRMYAKLIRHQLTHGF